MNRREFLAGTAAAAAAVNTLAPAGLAQAPQGGAAPAGGQGGRAGGAGRGRGAGPANVSADKLARISLMTLNFGMYRSDTNQPPSPDRTLTVFDLPKMYVEMYGVHHIEFQLGDVRPSEKDPAFIKELKAKLDESKLTMSQVNLEFGNVETISNSDPAGRQQAVDHCKQWVDIAVQYGCKRLMLNQQQAMLTQDRRADAVAAMKAMADYGRPKGVMISVETRGAGAPEFVQALGMKPWEFMGGIIKDAGANSNVDIGNVGASNQQELHDCIKSWLPTSSGNMHIKSSPNWDIGTAVRFTESLGYKGLYAIEVSQHPAIRIVYNTILANL